jgi:hypothetical protein
MGKRWPGLPTFAIGIVLVGWSLFMSLSTHLSPPGKIIDLELAKSGADVSRVICKAERRVNDTPVRWNTNLDFVLIPAYVGVLCVFSLQSLELGVRPLAWLGAVAAVLAGLFDIREDLGIFRALASTGTCSFTDQAAIGISLSSWIKWILLFVGMVIIGIRLAITQRRVLLLKISGLVLILSGAIGLPGLQRHRPDLSMLGLGISVLLVLVQFVIGRAERA